MAKKKEKYYVVWVGRQPGVYDDYDDAMEQVYGFPGAKFKSFNSPEEATEAYRLGTHESDSMDLGRLLAGATVNKKTGAGKKGSAAIDWRNFPEIDRTAWAVDASCLGNPGRMEYRGVELASGKELFRVGPFEDATNNIGEFLAIVHAMALMEQRGETHLIYSDSVSGMAWARRKKINTQLQHTDRNEKVFQLMARGIAWLLKHKVTPKVMKWQTELWGEIPADFGRK
ncbi:MAG: ribonuclease H [Bacteroides sp.]|nr:ribonuclease H [Bacteroides sp.]